MPVLPNGKKSSSGSGRASETILFGICEHRIAHCRRPSLTVVHRTLRPRGLQTEYVIAETLPSSRRPVPGRSFGAVVTRNATSWNGSPALQRRVKPIQRNPRDTLAPPAELAKPTSASRCVMPVQVLHQLRSHRRCSATRPVTGRQVIVSTRRHRVWFSPSRFRLSERRWPERTEAHQEFRIGRSVRRLLQVRPRRSLGQWYATEFACLTQRPLINE